MQAVQKYDHRQKTARILYCGVQAETYPGGIRCDTWGKKCENCPVMLVNVRRTYCTAKCRRLFNLDREEKRDAKKAEAVRAAKADPNYLKNQVKKVQREAEERRRALRGLS